MIQYLGVTKEYTHGMSALKDISFEVSEGEFVFLVGPSGSGKTTLIKMLIREELPTSGKIFFHDQDVTKFKQKEIYQLRRKVGVIFQDYKLIPELNAYENIAFAMEVAGRSDKDIRENVPYLLDIVGLSNRMKFFPRQLSGGEKQRVAIARSIANNPSVLLADEPTGNLDPESAWDIVQILNKINNWGTTVIMSTHGSDIVNTLHKRVIKMEDGKLIRDVLKGTYEELDDFSMKIISSTPNVEKQPPKETAKSKKEKPKKEDLSSITATKEDLSSVALAKDDTKDFEAQILSDIKEIVKTDIPPKSKKTEKPKQNAVLEKEKVSEKETSTDTEIKPKASKLKQYKKKIKFSTKNLANRAKGSQEGRTKKKQPNEKSTKSNEPIAESKPEEVKPKSTLDLPKKLLTKLASMDMFTIEDIKEIGLEDLKKIDIFGKKDLKKLEQLITDTSH